MYKDIEKLKEELKKQLSEKRFLHSLGVMNMCEKLANIYGGNIEKLKLIGLMHDCCKEMSKEEMLKYVHENNIICSSEEKAIAGILHGKIAADVCKKKYDFDEEMCTAIAYHTTGKENMTLMEKILFISDKVDETRNYSNAVELRKLALTDIDKAIVMNLDYTIIKNIEDNKLVLEESIKARNYLLLNSEIKKNM